jgi:hypothetical protein
VARLAELSGIEIPEADLEPVAVALTDHLRFVAPLLALDLSSWSSALSFEPEPDA